MDREFRGYSEQQELVDHQATVTDAFNLLEQHYHRCWSSIIIAAVLSRPSS